MVHEKGDRPEWERAERKLISALNLHPTLASGRFWSDPGDAVTYEGDNRPFKMMGDSKSTLSKSYSVNRDFMEKFRERAMMHGGKEPLLHIQFQQENKPDRDWVLMELGFFAEVLGTAENIPDAVQPWEFTHEQAIAQLERLAERIKDPAERLATYLSIKTLKGSK